jgi:hypothetical protein
MTERRRIDPSRVTGALQTEHCDIPDGMTLAEWRRLERTERAERAAAAKRQGGPVRRGLRRVLRRAA